MSLWRPDWAAPFVAEVVEDKEAPQHRPIVFFPLLAFASLVGLGLQLIVVVESCPAVEAIAPAMAWLVAASLVLFYKPLTAPFAVFVVFVMQAINQVVLLGTNNERPMTANRPVDIALLLVSMFGALVALLMPLRDPNLSAEGIAILGLDSHSSVRSPEDNLTLWQFMTVSWMGHLQRIGSSRQLEDDDVWQLPYEFQHQRLHDKFRLLKGTVIQRLIKANAIDLCILTALGILELVMQYATPVLLQLLLSSMEDITAPKREAIIYAALAMFVRLVAAQSGVFSLWFGRRCYERSRGEMITLLYEKTLGRKVGFTEQRKAEETKVNGEANGTAMNGEAPKPQLRQWWQRMRDRMAAVFKRTKSPEPSKEPASMGKILNLMRNDVYEVAQRFWEFQAIIQKPLSVFFSVTLVVRFLGWPSLIAVSMMILAQCLNLILAKIMVHFEKKRRAATDGKLKVISQFVEAIRHLRWYGWQGEWLTQIMTARQKELSLKVITNLWNLSIAFTNTLSLDLTPTVAFFAYTVIAGKSLRVDIAFPAMQLFSMLTMALRDLPQLINVLINAYVAVGRIEDFMAEPDKEENDSKSFIGNLVAFDGATLAWPGSMEPVLRDIDLVFSKGINVVFGEVASGKTALLQGLLGELDKLEGHLLRPNKPIGYCSQTPWLQSMSIRENILFGAPYDLQRYNHVIYACALMPDLAVMAAGDFSMIGENGIGLSGGQRARIALARAVYSNAPILLLDDPFSALDQETAEKVMSRLFTTHTFISNLLMVDRTIVLVTHRIDLVISYAKMFVEVDKGRASEVPWELVSSNLQRITSIPTRDNKEAEDQHRQRPDDDTDAVPQKFIEDEYRAQGGVKSSVYWEFVKAGKLWWWAILVIVLVLYRLAAITEAWYLKTWGEAYKTETTTAFFVQESAGFTTRTPILDDLPPPDEDIRPWLLGFLSIGLYKSVSFVMYQGVLMVITYVSGKNLFASAMEKVAGATFRYYDVTPVGRLMNRMTSDMGVIDGNISFQLQAVAWLTISWLSAIAVIGSVTPTFLVFAIFLTVAFVMIFRRFIPTSQSLRRLEMVSLTPLMSNFGSLLHGLTTVRAFQVQKQFQGRVIRVVDTFQKMDHFYWSLQAWLMYRYDVLSAISTFLITLLALATNISAGLTAFVLLAAGKLVQSTHLLCKQYGQLQMEFVSVERATELLHLEQEPKGDVTPPAWWPSFRGDIVFRDVMIRYAPGLDLALRGLSVTIKGGSKTAVLGRTGSGKSTMALALLATVVPEAGHITIDSIDLATVDRQLLRSRVTFVAQDPVLFPGTMRQNLDPTNQHSDEECEVVLRRVCEKHGWSLSTHVEAGGRNFSQGQRQLVGLTRAVICQSSIIILDEATASIDQETAMQIQQVMHEELPNSTIITIAHRLEAAKGAEYCIVIGDGHVIQHGPVSGTFWGAGWFSDQDVLQ